MAKAKVQEEANLPAVAQGGAVAAWGDMGDMPTGFEGMRPQDFVIPYFTILQGLSPQIETVEGAKPGIIINTTTNQLYPTGFNFVAVKHLRQFVRWKPNRGGFVAAYPDESHPIVAELLKKVGGDQYAKLITNDGDEVQETFYATGVVISDEGGMTGLGQVAFKSTAIKKYKAWRTYQANIAGEHKIRPFQIGFHFGSVKEKNSKGEFYNWKFEPYKKNVFDSVVTDAEVVAAVKELLSRDVNINYEGDAKSQANTEGEEAM